MARHSHKNTVNNVLESIKLGSLSTVDQLKNALENQRRTRIQIIETPLLNGVAICGVWGKKDGDDLIFHAETRSPIHRDQIVLHELSHMILNHDTNASNAELSLLHSILPDLNPNHFLLRTPGIKSPTEREAEQLAYQLATELRHSNQQTNQFDKVFG